MSRKDRKCPVCFDKEGLVNFNDYCQYHAQERFTGKLGIIDYGLKECKEDKHE